MKRRLVVEHEITSKKGDKFNPLIIDAAKFGDDFDRYMGETHVHTDGMRGSIPVGFRQTFLITDETDQVLMRKFAH